MSEYPTISRGLGKLTPDLWDRLMDALAWVEQVGPELQVKRPDRRGGPPRSSGASVQLFRMLDAVPFGAERWSYGWELMRLDGLQFAVDSSGLTWADEGYDRAVNPEEAGNNGVTHGYGIPYSTSVGSLTPQPLELGSIVPGVLLPDGLTDTAVLRPVLMPATNALAIACATP